MKENSGLEDSASGSFAFDTETTSLDPRKAELVGVSVATVSRALKSPDIVSPSTREKVLKAVEQAGYKPNLMVVQFRSQRTHNLVVLVPAIANTFFARVISGIQEAAQERGYGVLLCNTLGNETMETHYASLVSTRQADGVIQLRAFNPFAENAFPSGTPLPMINACEVLDNAPCPTVQPSPMTWECPVSQWTTQLSWMLLRAPMRMEASSPRTLQPNQMLASSPSSISPVTMAVKATIPPPGTRRIRP